MEWFDKPRISLLPLTNGFSGTGVVHNFFALGSKVEGTVGIIVVAFFRSYVCDHHRMTAAAYGILKTGNR